MCIHFGKFLTKPSLMTQNWGLKISPHTLSIPHNRIVIPQSMTHCSPCSGLTFGSTVEKKVPKASRVNERRSGLLGKTGFGTRRSGCRQSRFARLAGCLVWLSKFYSVYVHAATLGAVLVHVHPEFFQQMIRLHLAHQQVHAALPLPARDGDLLRRAPRGQRARIRR